MKLSFLITYHEEGEWLTECVQSVLGQLAPDDEVLIYDDASRDPAQAHAPTDARVRCLRGASTIGPARGRNLLVQASRGTHLHFHDADDLCAPHWRTRVAAAFSADTDVVFTDVASFNEQGERWHGIMNVTRLAEERDLLAFALRGGMLAPSGTYRRAIVERIGGYNASLWQSEDYDFHIRLALARPVWRALPEDLVLIRRHGSQRSRLKREVWACAIDSLAANAAHFPVDAHGHVARAATRAGSELFAVGAEADAERAFALARTFGGPRYERGMMQRLTRLFGAMSAEKIAATYRRVVPAPLRVRARRTAR